VRLEANTLAWLALYLQGTAQALGALAHGLQAQVSEKEPCGIEARSVVLFCSVIVSAAHSRAICTLLARACLMVL